MWLVFLLSLFFPLYSWAYDLAGHSWTLTDVTEKRLSLDGLERTLKTNWDREASTDDLAHLYAFQLWKKSQIQTAKIFLLSESTKAIVATVVNDTHHLYAFDHIEKKFIHIEDWKHKYSKGFCEELINPSTATIFKIQEYYPKDHCLYMIVPSHIYKQVELYPTSTPKDFEEDEIAEACYQATDRKLFRRDHKRCRNWVRNP